MVRISPRYNGILVEFFRAEQLVENDGRSSPELRQTKTIGRSFHGRAPQSFSNNQTSTSRITGKNVHQQHPKILMTDIQSICATKCRSENELRILSSDEEILIRASDQAERDKILEFVSSMELNRFVSLSSGSLVDGKLWCQDRRLLPSQKQSVPMNTDLPGTDKDVFKPRDQTYDSLTALRRSVGSPFKRVLEQVHTIHMLKEALEEEEEGVRTARPLIRMCAVRRASGD